MKRLPAESSPQVVTVTAMLGDSTLMSRRLTSAAPSFTAGNSPSADLPVELAGTNGALFPLVRLTSTGAQVQLPGAAPQDVPAGGHLLCPLGSVNLLVHCAPAGLVKGAILLGGIDWEAQAYRAGSFMVHAMVLFLAFALPPRADATTPDTTFRKVQLVLPQFDKDKEIKPWLKEPVRDDKAAPVKDARPSRRPTGSPAAGDPKKPPGGGPANPKHLAQESVRNTGVIDILNKSAGSSLASLFAADSALTDGAMAAMDGLQGDTLGEGTSIGGLSLTNIGGWGPHSGVISGPLGTISGRPGRGGGPSGYGGGFRLPGRKPTNSGPRERVAQPKIEKGALSKSIIRRVIRRHLNEVRYCYQRELQTNQDLYGRLIVKFTIAPNGQVVTAGVKKSSLGNATVETCITQAVRRWLFPKPRDGGIVMVSYPFVLKAAGR